MRKARQKKKRPVEFHSATILLSDFSATLARRKVLSHYWQSTEKQEPPIEDRPDWFFFFPFW